MDIVFKIMCTDLIFVALFLVGFKITENEKFIAPLLFLIGIFLCCLIVKIWM